MIATSEDTAHDLVSGQVVAGRYEIDRPLGEGGMGVVYLAHDRSLGSERRVALKILARRFVGRPVRERRFANEARFAGRLSTHTNLATTLDAGRIEDGRPYIAMEYVDGPAINGLRVVTGRTIPPLEVCRMARGIADALRVVHQAGLVHRDLTPTNILMAAIGGEWVPKLIDFSHAAAVDGPRLELGHPSRLTQPHETPGTPGYMSPEQVGNAYPAPSMDVFAFGVVLWELLAERHAFRQRDRAEYFAKQREAPQSPPSLAEHRSGLPSALYELVDDCTNVDPTKRPRTADLVERLDSVIWGLTRGEPATEGRGASGSMRATIPVPLTVAAPHRNLLQSELEDPGERPRRPWLVLVALLAIVLTAGVFAWLWLRGEERPEARNESLSAADGTETKSTPTPAVDMADEPPAVATTGAPEAEVEPSVPSTPPKKAKDDAAPEVTPEPDEPEPTSSAKIKAPPRKPATSVRDSAECIALRAAADAARERLDWSEVLNLTKQSRCWAANTRARLRVRALLDLGRHEQCVREYGNSRDAAVMSAANVCKESLNP
jgi:eukaryotic-like serine/threonine-protein kinase